MYRFIGTSICIHAFQLALGAAHGQTMVDLRTQSKSVDFKLACTATGNAGKSLSTGIRGTEQTGQTGRR
jgi:ApbE superfamily uncharacterized protein (UPF0280 family)